MNFFFFLAQGNEPVPPLITKETLPGCGKAFVPKVRWKQSNFIAVLGTNELQLTRLHAHTDDAISHSQIISAPTCL